MEIFKKQFISPKELASANVNLGLTTQWKKRKNGELKFIRVGSRIMYSQKQLTEFFELCESNAKVMLI